MKRHIAFICLAASLLTLVLAHETTTAQDFDDRQARAALTVGPSLTTGGSITLGAPEGFQIGPVFAWRGGVHTTYPLTSIISSGLELGLDSRGTMILVHNNSSIYNTYRVLYFSLYPNFTLGGFNLGFNFGFPMSATSTANTGRSLELMDTLDVPALVEGRIGAVIPLYDGEVGWASLVIGAGYSFSELVNYPDQSEVFGTWKNVSAHLGARFEFAIPGTER